MKNFMTSVSRFEREYPELVSAVENAMGEAGLKFEDYLFRTAGPSFDPDDADGTFFATYYPKWVMEARERGDWGPYSYSWVQVQGVKGVSGPLTNIEVLIQGEH